MKPFASEMKSLVIRYLSQRSLVEHDYLIFKQFLADSPEFSRVSHLPPASEVQDEAIEEFMRSYGQMHDSLKSRDDHMPNDIDAIMYMIVYQEMVQVGTLNTLSGSCCIRWLVISN